MCQPFQILSDILPILYDRQPDCCEVKHSYFIAYDLNIQILKQTITVDRLLKCTQDTSYFRCNS